jgi:starvation-inducible outer membrane lipoprotein
VERCKEVNVKIVAGLLVLSWAVVSACAPTDKVFPPTVLEGVDSHFDFSNWYRMTTAAEVKKVRLGGRIVQSQASEDRVTIVVSQLPIVEHPAYGPRDTGKNNGEFAITYRGRIEASLLQPGNRMMVVGMTRPQKVLTVNDLSRSFPIVEAQCLHVWNTQGRNIEDFPFYEAGYVALRQETVCARPPTP